MIVKITFYDFDSFRIFRLNKITYSIYYRYSILTELKKTMKKIQIAENVFL